MQYILGDIHSYFLKNAGRLGTRLNCVPFQPGSALPAGRLRVRFPMVSLDFFMDMILSAALWPCCRLSHQHKWVPEIFPGCKCSRCVRLTILTPTCADCLEVWETQPLGPLRCVQACTGDYITYEQECQQLHGLDDLWQKGAAQLVLQSTVLW
jgi:hypothetical protein